MKFHISLIFLLLSFYCPMSAQEQSSIEKAKHIVMEDTDQDIQLLIQDLKDMMEESVSVTYPYTLETKSFEVSDSSYCDCTIVVNESEKNKRGRDILYTFNPKNLYSYGTDEKSRSDVVTLVLKDDFPAKVQVYKGKKLSKTLTSTVIDLAATAGFESKIYNHFVTLKDYCSEEK